MTITEFIKMVEGRTHKTADPTFEEIIKEYKSKNFPQKLNWTKI